MHLSSESANVISVDTPPFFGLGTPGAIGTLALTSGGQIFLKIGPGNNDWLVQSISFFTFQTNGATSDFREFNLGDTTVNPLNITKMYVVTACQVSGGVGAPGDGLSVQTTLNAKSVTNVASIMAQTDLFSYKVDAGLSVTYTAVGNSVRVTCTGVAGRNIRWAISELPSGSIG